MLINEFVRISLFTPEEEKDDLLIYLDGVGYSYTDNKLVIRDILKEALSNDGVLIIDPVFDVFDAILSDDIKNNLISLVLNNITRLCDSAFKNCVNLKSVVGNKIKSLPCDCFSGCINLTNFMMSQLVIIKENALADCDLSEFMAGKLTNIESFAFHNSSVKEISCGKKAKIQCYAFANTLSLEKFTAESLEWVDSLFYSSPRLKYIDIGYYKDSSNYYDESNKKDRLYNWLDKLNVSNKDEYLDADSYVYNFFYKKNNYEFKFHMFYQEFNYLKYLKEFHYKLDNNLDINMQKYFESRLALIGNGTKIKVIRDL